MKTSRKRERKKIVNQVDVVWLYECNRQFERERRKMKKKRANRVLKNISEFNNRITLKTNKQPVTLQQQQQQFIII